MNEEIPITPDSTETPRPIGGISITKQINGLIKAMEGVAEIMTNTQAAMADMPQERPSIDDELTPMDKIHQGLEEAQNAFVKFD